MGMLGVRWDDFVRIADIRLARSATSLLEAQKSQDEMVRTR